MPTNHYFDLFRNPAEQELYNELIKETIYTYGIDCQYLPRTSQSSQDLLFGEDPTSKFTEAYPTAVYVQSVDNFEGGELFSKFGLEVRKQARFLISKDNFRHDIPSTYTRPREGDLVWMKNFAALFEIKYVDEEYFFYNFGNKNIYGYSLVCEKFRYSNELVDTGVTDLDNTVDTVVPSFEYIMANTGTGTFQFGELVSNGNSSATVTTWNLPTFSLSLKHIQGEFVVGDLIIGANSNAQFTVANTAILNDVNNGMSNNELIENQGENIISFTETNPFGEPDMNE
jgi:Virus neck protein